MPRPRGRLAAWLDRGYVTLDCRDGAHRACEGCYCPHHREESR